MGIGIVVVIVILVLFTNIDDLLYPQIEETISQIEIDNPVSEVEIPFVDYEINNHCEFLYALVSDELDFFTTEIPDHLIQEYIEKSQKVYENHGVVSCHQAFSPSKCFQDLRDLENEMRIKAGDERISELTSSFILNPSFVKELKNRTPDFFGILTPEDVAEDPVCAEKYRKRPLEEGNTIQISVYADKIFYQKGELVKIAGYTVYKTQSVLIKISSLDKKEITSFSTLANEDGKYTTTWMIPKDMNAGKFVMSATTTATAERIIIIE